MSVRYNSESSPKGDVHKMKNRSTRLRSLEFIPFIAIAMLLMQTQVYGSTTPANAIAPFSWAQFKAVYGLPSTPTVPDNSAQIDTFDGSTTAADPNIFAGEQLRAYRIGDYGMTLPPSGSSNFLDLEAGPNVGDSLVDWAGPFYGSSSASSQDLVVDDDNTQNSITVTPAVGPAQTFTYGGFAESNNWNAVSANTAETNGTDNFYGDSYQIIPASNRLAEDDGDNGVSPNYAHWVPYIQTAGFYTVYAYFPSENLTLPGTPGSPEPHVTDARYTVYIQLPGQPLNKFQVTVNQQTGGNWVPVGTAHYFPQTSNDGQFNATNPLPTDIAYFGAPTYGLTTSNTNAFVDIRVDDTTSNSTTTAIGTTNYQNYIVADAIELRGGDGLSTRVYGTPVAVNTTPPILSTQNSLTSATGSCGDYTEIALGYGAGASTGDGKTGGKPIRYQTDMKQTTNATTVGDFFPSVTGANANGVLPQIFAGSVGYDPTLPSTPPNAAIPIDQVVYFTRTETVQTDPNDASQTAQVGYVYAVNGENGDVIWRYPNTSPDVIGDTDPYEFQLLYGIWLDGANTQTSYNNETYVTTPAVASAAVPTAAAKWTPTSLTAGTYFVYAYFPSPGGGENHVSSAHYTVNDSLGNAYSCYVNQQNGGQWVQLTNVNTTTGTVTSTFNLNSSSNVVLTNDTTDFTGANPDGEVVCADAVEFIPTASMGTSDSTPAVVRNMKVFDAASATYLSRTVVIVTDNLGKMYCLDASGNGDGDDTLYDSNNLPVYISTSGAGYETYDSTTGLLSNLAPTPWHPLNYGTTSVYWIWQPDEDEPIASNQIVDDSNAAATSFTGAWAASTTAIVGAYNFNDHTDSSITRTSAKFDDFYWYPTISTTASGSARIYVSVGQQDGKPHVDDARYTVVDDTGTAYQCLPINETVTTPAFVQLVALNGQTAFNFGPTAATGANEVFLDNSTNDSGNPEVIADAVEFVYNGGLDANSNLIPPLAFQTCSPTVHVVPDTTLAVPSVTNATTGTTIKYDAYDAKIYVGNSNGVLYALDGAGASDGSNFYQRDLSQDPAMPSPSVDWWFNVGLQSTDIDGEIQDNPNSVTSSIAGTPAYYHAPGNGASTSYDQIMFTTFSPLTGASGGVNSGNLYSVNAIGPIGDYGAGPVPDQLANFATSYPSAAGTTNYNLSPIPLFSFPDAYGTPHLPNTISPIIPAIPGTDHIVTSLVPPTTIAPQIVPPAHSLGDSGGSPVVFGGPLVPDPLTGLTVAAPYRVYFAANDPTADGEQPTEGRIWGVNLTPGSNSFGTVDTLSGYAKSDDIYSYIYPFPVPPSVAANPSSTATYTPVGEGNGGSFDPNLIATNNANAISNIYDFNNQNGPATGDNQQFGPFTSPPAADASPAYYVSSSPAAAIVHTIPTGSGNTLTPTLVGGPNPTGGNYPIEYGSATGAYDIDIPTLYVGDLQGTLHSVNLAGYSDDSRFLQDVNLDGSAIESTPCVLANGNGATPFTTLDTGGNNVGGVVFTTTQDGALYESEALPFIESSDTNITDARGLDFGFGGPGGFSSVASASFNIDNFTFTKPPTATSADAGVDTSEWIYAGSDSGFTYGLSSSNTALGNGFSSTNSGGFNPGATINPENNPPDTTLALNRNFITAVLPTNPIVNGVLTYNATAGRPPENPVFDYGQTAYIVFYGLDDPNAGTGTLPATASYPKSIRLTFTIKPLNSTSSTGIRGGSKIIDLDGTGNAVSISGVWPPVGSGFTLEKPGATTTASDPSLIGPYAAVYAYQLGTPNSGDAQTPGAVNEISNISEQVAYYSTGANSTLIYRSIPARTDSGTVIRASNGAGGYKDEQTQPIDQATFGILNPLAVRSLGRTMGSTGSPASFSYFDLTFVPSNYANDKLFALGPFSGADSTGPSTFPTYQAADANGNDVPQTAPVGGTITTSSGTTINPNDPSADQLPRPKTIDVTIAVSPGLVGHGLTGVSSTPNATVVDPANSAIDSADAPIGPVNSPANLDSAGEETNTREFGESILDIADRSALGTINQSLTDLKENSFNLQWNDNSGVGGAMAVVNPLPWENMPTAFTTLGSQVNNSRDYPDISKADANIELLPRLNNYNAYTGPGSDTVITSSVGTLAAATPDVNSTDGAVTRTINPNAALLHVAVPKFQPANLDSYDPTTNPGVLEQGSTRLNSSALSIGQGYQEDTKIFIASASTGAYNSRLPYRDLQVWLSVPVDLSTSIKEQEIDVGAVPSGFGLNLTTSATTPDNSGWSPFEAASSNSAASSALNLFYKPITILNVGNTNLINLHLNQFNYLMSSTTTSLPNPVANPIGSYTVSDESVIPTFDSGAFLTGSTDEPILRSSLDYDLPSGNGTDAYNANANEFTQNGSQPEPPGPTAHKPLVGDQTGAVVTVPDVPHNNLSGGHWSIPSLNTSAYQGRPVLSVAVPLGTPTGLYQQTVSAFEGSDEPNGTSSVYQGPTYGGYFYTTNGWWNSSGTTETAPTSFVNGLMIDTANNTTYQTVSNPSPKVTIHVVEDRLTDGPPLPETSASGPNQQAVAPMSDMNAAGMNNNDLQPWAFYAPVANGTPEIGLLWTSQRKATAATPYSLFGSLLPLSKYSAANGGMALPSYPEVPVSGSMTQWWTTPNPLTEIGSLPANETAQQSYGGSTFSYGNSQYAIYVTSAVINGTPLYKLEMAPIAFSSAGPSYGTASPIFTSTLPVFSPRASYITGGGGFTPTGAGAPLNPPVSTLPLIVYYTHVSGRSTLMYWPATATINGTATITSAPLPLPIEMTAVATPTIIPRPEISVTVNGAVQLQPQVDIVYSGELAPNSSADICTGRYDLTVTSNGAAQLAQAATLPPVPFTPVAPSTLTLPTVNEALTKLAGTEWQSRDVGWYRDPGAFQLSANCEVNGNEISVPLVPGGSVGSYDHASGEWIFSINFTNLASSYSSVPYEAQLINDLAVWWTNTQPGNTPPNVVVYAKPGSGLVGFSISPPVNSTVISAANHEVFQSLSVSIDPTILRTTFMSQSNTAPISFIDDTYKTNAAPGDNNNVETARYWYIYRKQTAAPNNATAGSSVLYYDTRRLTLVLPTPVLLHDSGSGYSLGTLGTDFDVKDSSNFDVTSQVDVDWARGRIYFPETYQGATGSEPSEGQMFTVTYDYAALPVGFASTRTASGYVSWMDEYGLNQTPANSSTTISTVGEQPLPINTPNNETEPSAFLDPNAGLGGTNSTMTLNPSSVTPSYPNGQPYPHKVWVFWTSNRNAKTNGTGSDIYWETIDPKFEVQNP